METNNDPERIQKASQCPGSFLGGFGTKSFLELNILWAKICLLTQKKMCLVFRWSAGPTQINQMNQRQLQRPKHMAFVRAFDGFSAASNTFFVTFYPTFTDSLGGVLGVLTLVNEQIDKHRFRRNLKTPLNIKYP